MTPSELKQLTEQTSPYFFTRETMKFFGDTMKNYGVRSCQMDTATRKDVSTWELYRKRPVKHGLQNSAYFDKKTFGRVLPEI